MHNMRYPHNPYQDSTNFNDNFSYTSSLFSDHEQKALQSFLDGLDRDDDLSMSDVSVPQHMSQQLYSTSFSTQPQQTYTSRSVPSNFPPTSAMNIPVTGRPTPVMLSSPLTTSYTSPQHYSTVPLTHPSPLDTTPPSSLPDPAKRAVTSKAKQSDRRKNSKPYTNPNVDPSNPPIKSEPPSTPTRGPIKKPSRRKSAPASASPADSPPAGGQDDGDMASDDDRSVSGGASRGGRGKKPPHELLTEAEKKANHIASEQKRRQNIRVGFDQLVDIVPTLSQCHRSEALILQKSVEYIRQLLSQKDDLKERVRDLQGVLGDASMDEDSSEGELDFAY